MLECWHLSADDMAALTQECLLPLAEMHASLGLAQSLQPEGALSVAPKPQQSGKAPPQPAKGTDLVAYVMHIDVLMLLHGQASLDALSCLELADCYILWHRNCIHRLSTSQPTECRSTPTVTAHE